MIAQALRVPGGRYYLALGLTFLVLLGALGGASRADELQQSLIRLAAILAIVAALWQLDLRVFRDGRPFVVALVLLYLLPIVQLVPLPAAVWARMPQHAVYADIADRAGSIAWRPWSLSPDLTLNALGALLPATAAGLVALALDFRERLIVARLIVAIACVSAILGLLQLAAGGSALHLFRTTSANSAVGLFANRNHQAVLMAGTLPLLAATASIRLRKESVDQPRTVAVALAAAFLLVMGLACTGSRMGLVLGAVGLAGALLIARATVDRESWFAMIAPRYRWGVAALGLAAAGAIAVLVTRSGGAGRLAHEPIDQTRLASLGPMLAAARAFLPFGSGFGTFQPVYQGFEPDTLLSTVYLNQAHNEVMQIAIEGGVPAFALLLLFLVWWITSAIRVARAGSSVSRRALGISMVALSLILMLSSLVDYPLRTPFLSSLFAIACVELLRSRRHVNKTSP